MKVATRFAIDRLRTLLGKEQNYKTLVLGSLHNIPFEYHTQIDWKHRGSEGNANFMFDEINSGDWNLIFNCCCEHMYPMSEIKLPATYVLQSNDFYSDNHINRHRDIDSFLKQVGLDEIYYYNTSFFDGTAYFTVIGEKW